MNQYPPPQQGYPPPQQGYQHNAPPPQHGYPPPQQGYAPPQPGYQLGAPAPPPQQGYAPQQGYPPPQQGYPPPQQGYPPTQQAQAPPQHGYHPPQQVQSPPTQGYPPPQQGHPTPQQPPAPQQQGYPPPQQAPAIQPSPPQPSAQTAPAAPADPVPVSQLPPPPQNQAVPGSGNSDLPGSIDDDGDNQLGEDAKGDIPLSAMEVVSGYDNMNDFIPPPPLYEEYKEPPPPDFSAQLPQLTEDEAREALLSYTAEKCCWGSKAAKELTFTNIDPSAAFHYVLETFTENRKTSWASEPYVGQAIDGPMNGPAPMPWAITVQNPPMFQDTITHLEVPHTASVKPCHDCRASGYRRCHRCYGRGTIRCNTCDGRGQRRVSRYDGERHYTDYEHCHWCGGDGRRRCGRCDGSGRIVCVTCNAQGQLKCYIRLTVKWKNHVEDHIVERTNLPDELVRDVSGQQVFQEEHPKVWPIKGFPINDVNTGSNMLVQRHAMAYSNERLHRQRHQIRVIPVAEAKCSYSDETFTYFVYGFERKIHAPEYPMQCCWGCTIL